MKKIIVVLLIILFLIILFGANQKIIIYSPATPSSVPVILAGNSLPNTEVVIFADHSQANAMFLKEDIQVLVTGIDVGLQLYSKKVPIQLINSYVSGLSFLVTSGKEAKSFKDLKGMEIYLPFEGSPIEEITKFFVAKEGLQWNTDIKPKYAAFPSSVELLRQGKIEAAVLPEPFISILSKQQNIFINFSLKNKWEEVTQIKNGYPQVGSFVNLKWAKTNKDFIKNFNEALIKAIESISKNSNDAVDKTISYFKFPLLIMQSAMKNTFFYMEYDVQLEQSLFRYYQILGNPLNEQYKNFIYTASK